MSTEMITNSKYLPASVSEKLAELDAAAQRAEPFNREALNFNKEKINELAKLSIANFNANVSRVDKNVLKWCIITGSVSVASMLGATAFFYNLVKIGKDANNRLVSAVLIVASVGFGVFCLGFKRVRTGLTEHAEVALKNGEELKAMELIAKGADFLKGSEKLVQIAAEKGNVMAFTYFAFLLKRLKNPDTFKQIIYATNNKLPQGGSNEAKHAFIKGIGAAFIATFS